MRWVRPSPHTTVRPLGIKAGHGSPALTGTAQGAAVCHRAGRQLISKQAPLAEPRRRSPLELVMLRSARVERITL